MSSKGQTDAVAAIVELKDRLCLRVHVRVLSERVVRRVVVCMRAGTCQAAR